MTLFQKIKSCLAAALMMAIIFILLFLEINGPMVIMLILGISLLLSGLKDLIYFFAMARYMVDGRIILYKSILYLDLGAFTISMFDINPIYIMVYLLILCVFYGFLSIMRAREIKRLGSSTSWIFKLSEGIVYIVVAVLGLIFIRNQNVAIIIYCAALFFSAVNKIIVAFKPQPVFLTQ